MEGPCLEHCYKPNSLYVLLIILFSILIGIVIGINLGVLIKSKGLTFGIKTTYEKIDNEN